MRIKYDPQVDILRVLLNEEQIEESDEVAPGFIVDYDSGGKIVGFEIMDASESMDNPFAVQLELAGFASKRPEEELVAVGA